MDRMMLLAGIGGLLGRACYYLTATFCTKTFPSTFPYGTFIANISGCLLIGIFYGLSGRHQWLTPEYRVFLTTGFCGGYTTFSSFAYENITLIQTAQYATFAVYSIASFALGLLAVLGGLLLMRIMG